MTDKGKLSRAVSQRKNIPPLQRGKGIQISSEGAQQSELAHSQQSESTDLQESNIQDEHKSKSAVSQGQEAINTQNSDNQSSQFRKNADLQSSESAIIETSNEATMQNMEITEEQLKEFAKILQKVITKEQNQDKAKQQKIDASDLLIQSLANVPFWFPELEQFRKLAEAQRKKVNQGVTIPESLFSIYKSCAMSYTLRNKKMTMGDLMAKALIKYLVEDIIPELKQD